MGRGAIFLVAVIVTERNAIVLPVFAWLDVNLVTIMLHARTRAQSVRIYHAF